MVVEKFYVPPAGGPPRILAGRIEKMTDWEFSGHHKAQFQELLATGLELHAINIHEESLDFGPWKVLCDRGDPDTALRLKTRFRAAARKAASATSAPCRVNLLDWWISKLVRGQKRAYIQGLIQRSAEYCEELESNALELRPLVQEMEVAPGLRRDRYPFEHPVPYWLYAQPHRLLADPSEEFAYWDKHIWHSFDTAVEEIVRLPRKRRRWVDKEGVKHCEAREETRRRLRNQVENRTKILDALIMGLSYDLAVLQANHVVDRGFRGPAAMRSFENGSAELIERVKSAFQKSSRRLGLSWPKQEKRHVELAKPFREVGWGTRSGPRW
jgi:hypothetical protein